MPEFFSHNADFLLFTASTVAAFAALAWALLLLEIPRIDAIGSHPNFAAHFFVVVSGARMTGWVWFAWVGLLLLAIGGLLEARGVFHQ